MDVNPGWVGGTYLLSDTSKCIGAGRDSVQIGSVWYRAPGTCYSGSLRPNPAGSQPDIGANESPLSMPVTAIDDMALGVPAAFLLMQNYPNPFNPSTTIRYGLPERSHVTLSVFNTLGQQVTTLVDGVMEAGYHEVIVNASHLASGVYLYQLRAGTNLETRRLMYLK